MHVGELKWGTWSEHKQCSTVFSLLLARVLCLDGLEHGSTCGELTLLMLSRRSVSVDMRTQDYLIFHCLSIAWVLFRSWYHFSRPLPRAASVWAASHPGFHWLLFRCFACSYQWLSVIGWDFTLIPRCKGSLNCLHIQINVSPKMLRRFWKIPELAFNQI